MHEDDDIPTLTAADFARARPAHETFSEAALVPFRRGRGRPAVETR